MSRGIIPRGRTAIEIVNGSKGLRKKAATAREDSKIIKYIFIYIFLVGGERRKSSEKIRRNDLLNRRQDKRIKSKSLVELFKREGHISKKRVESDLLRTMFQVYV